MRRRWVYPKDGEPFEVSQDFHEGPTGPLIIPDLPGYQSPVTGVWVEGRRQRREDLKRTGSRPWEGMEQESKVAQSHARDEEKRSDARIERAAQMAWHQLSPEKRRILEST